MTKKYRRKVYPHGDILISYYRFCALVLRFLSYLRLSQAPSLPT